MIHMAVLSEPDISVFQDSKHRKKPPSRRWRRRPRNLLNAYIRRQRRVQWLETHIWHAKRFHLVDFCGWRLPDRSCQRGFRASYRDAVRHCVVQDLSFYVCVELRGPEEALLERLNVLCQRNVSQTFSNTKILSGTFEGRATLYEPGTYPLGCLGTVRFTYRPKIEGEKDRILWIWIHPALEAKVLEILRRLFEMTEPRTTSNTGEGAPKVFSDVTEYHMSKLFNPPTYQSSNGEVTLRILKHQLARFRLIGPKSGLVLSQILHQPADSVYPSILGSQTDFNRQWSVWKDIYSRVEVGRIDPGLILSLVTSDPRLFTEYKKRLPQDPDGQFRHLDQLPAPESILADSPIWSSEIRRFSLEKKISDRELNSIRQEANSNGGNILNSLSEKSNVIPMMLIQQHSSSRGHVGMGAGWDLILPAGWALPFWIALQYATARAVGLDFQRHFATETADQVAGFPRFWPDTEVGRVFQEQEKEELTKRYFRKPINRRVDYELLRITHPFLCPWRELIQGWIRVATDFQTETDEFFVLRDRIVLRQLETVFDWKPKKGNMDHDLSGLCLRYPRALVAVRLLSTGKGVPKSRALICLPTKEDLAKIKTQRTLNESESTTKSKSKWKISEAPETDSDLEFIKLDSAASGEMELDLETLFMDKKEKRLVDRKKKEKERKKAMRRRRKNGTDLPEKESEKVKAASFENITDSCQRRILGYVADGDFSFANGRGQAVGFCSLLALKFLFEEMKSEKTRFVLYRNTQSKYYRAATLSILS